MAAASYAMPRYRSQFYNPAFGVPSTDGTTTSDGGDIAAPAQPDNSAFVDPRDYETGPGSSGGDVGGAQSPLGGPNFSPSGVTSTTSPGEMTSQNRMFAAGRGGEIAENIGRAQGYYGGLQEQYRQQANQAFERLRQTPGFTPEEAAKIGVDYTQFQNSPEALQKQFLSPEEQSAISGDPNAAKAQMEAGVGNEEEALNEYGQNVSNTLSGYGENLSGAVDEYGRNLGGAVGQYGKGVGEAVGGLNEGLQSAQGKFSGLEEAVNNPALAFDPNSTEKQLSDTDVQNIKTAAGTRVGNQYRTAEDTLQRQAAAAGNTSPLALAAARERLMTSEAANQGDAELNADIAARQAQFGRASQIEQEREGAVRAQTGFKAGAATTEEQAAQAAAGLAGTQGIAAAERVGETGINAANTYGAARIGAANTYGQAGIAATERVGETGIQEQNQMTQQRYGANLTAEEQAAERAAMLAQNRQQTQTNVNQTQYNQGMQTAGANSAGAQTIGGARMAGEGAYRNFLTGQQGQAQTGYLTSQGQQVGLFGAQTGAMNQAAGIQEQNKNAPTGAQRWAGIVSGFLHKDGGIVTEPTLATVGERGPEAIIKLPGGRYRSSERKAA